MSGARGRTQGLLSSIRSALFGWRRAVVEDDTDEAFWERREAAPGSADEVVTRTAQWDLREDDVRGAIQHADTAFERGYQPQEIDAVEAAEEPGELSEGEDG